MNPKDILAAARNRLHVEELTPMQQSMAAVKAPAVILVAPTGSGKTLACALPLLQRVEQGHGLQAVVIAPARELVLQITKVFAALAPALRITAVYGGHPMIEETRSLEAATPDIIVGTPGRLLDHIQRRTIDPSATRALLLDEYDKSLELGFEAEMKRIVRAMRDIRFSILTSATRIAEMPAFMQLKSPLVMDFSAGSESAPKLDIHTVQSPEADKLSTLVELLESVPRERTMVFVNHRESAVRVHDHLIGEKLPVALYHGAMEQIDRETAIDLFTNGTSPILVCTDLAARGLDIPRVESVIHYHMPVSADAWTHRCGRAGRMGASGHVYAILGPGEECTYAPEADPYTPDPMSEPWRRQLLTLWFHAGKKEKLSRGDVAGALIRVAGLAPDAIGLISAHDHRILAAVPAREAASAAEILNSSKIKGHRIRVTLHK